MNKFALQNLKENTLWFTEADKMNDPYDSAFCFHFNSESMKNILINAPDSEKENSGLSDSAINRITSSGDFFDGLIAFSEEESGEKITDEQRVSLRSVLSTIFDKEMSEANRYFNEHWRQGYKICCFSERIDSMPMWAHYAENHQGFAISYNFSALPRDDVRANSMWPVIYESQLFDARNFFQRAAENPGSLNVFLGIFASMHKAIDWAYEREWRSILPLSPQEPSMNYPVPSPDGIYLGAKIDKTNEDRLVEIATQKGIPIFKMRLAHDEFKMIPEKIQASD